MAGKSLSRREFLIASGLSLAGASLAACTRETSKEVRVLVTPVPPEPAVTNSGQALQRLYEGNQRFIKALNAHPNLNKERRLSVAEAGQKPFAIIFGCVDSRVPPELIFDRGLGDLFVIRTAGHVLDNAALASLEFGVLELKIPLLMVLGHSECGAVEASVQAIQKKEKLPGQISTLVEAIRPAYETVKTMTGDEVANTVPVHIENTVKKVRASKVIGDAEKEGTVKVVGARYDVATGIVEITTM